MTKAPATRHIAATALPIGSAAVLLLGLAPTVSAGSLPPGYASLNRYPTSTYGESEFRQGAVPILSAPDWYVDGVLLDSHEQEIRLRFVDGKTHTVLSVVRDINTGHEYKSIATWYATPPMSATAPVQLAKIARKKGILVRVKGVSGFYRASTKSKKIPGSGNARVRAFDANGRIDQDKIASASIRIKGKYMSRIKPGSKLTVEARHLKGGYAFERTTVTVTFR